MAMTEDTFGNNGRRFTEQGTANIILAAVMPALISPSKKPFRIFFVTCKYSAAPTQTGVTIDLDSGVDAAYDTLLATGVANAQNTVYFPDGDLKIADDDGVNVTAPAGGVGITASIAIYGGYE